MAAHLCCSQPAGQHVGQVDRGGRRHWAGIVRGANAAGQHPPLGGAAAGWADGLGDAAGAEGSRIEPGGDAASLLSGAAAGQGGAAASALAIIVMGLVLAIGIFEQQEI